MPGAVSVSLRENSSTPTRVLEFTHESTGDVVRQINAHPPTLITLVICLRTKRTHLLWPVLIAIKVDLIAEK